MSPIEIAGLGFLCGYLVAACAFFLITLLWR